MTINGMTSAANALRYWERRQEVTANNLANVSTVGFKSERVFATLLDGAVPAIASSTDHRVGMLRQSGDPMDLANGGEGFLVIETPAGERWSRGGALRTDAEGFLTDGEGNQLLGEGGPIKMGTGPMLISRDGTVSFGGTAAGRLRLERAPAGTALMHEGGTRFLPSEQREPVDGAARDLRQGTLEESNADSLGGLVDLIGVQRAYAAVQKSITVLDHVRETATSQLGKPV